VNELDPGREVDGCVGVAVERLAGEDRHGGADPLAAGEDDVADLFGQLIGLDLVDNGLQPVLDQRDPALQVLHLSPGGTGRAKA